LALKDEHENALVSKLFDDFMLKKAEEDYLKLRIKHLNACCEEEINTVTEKI